MSLDLRECFEIREKISKTLETSRNKSVNTVDSPKLKPNILSQLDIELENDDEVSNATTLPTNNLDALSPNSSVKQEEKVAEEPIIETESALQYSEEAKIAENELKKSTEAFDEVEKELLSKDIINEDDDLEEEDEDEESYYLLKDDKNMNIMNDSKLKTYYKSKLNLKVNLPLEEINNIKIKYKLKNMKYNLNLINKKYNKLKLKQQNNIKILSYQSYLLKYPTLSASSSSSSSIFSCFSSNSYQNRAKEREMSVEDIDNKIKFKLKKNNSNYKKYVFVLKSNYLLQFSNPRVGEEHKIKKYYNLLDLKDIKRIKGLKSRISPTGYELRFYFKNKLLRLCPPNKDITLHWLKAIQNNILYHQQQDNDQLNEDSEDDQDNDTEGKREKDMVGYDLSLVLEEKNSSQDTYYDILKVSRSISNKNLKKKYYILAKKYHPDKFQDKEEIEINQKIFSKISKAYSVLSQPKLKKNYNLTLSVKLALRLGIMCKVYEHRKSVLNVEEDDKDVEQRKRDENEDKVIFSDEKYENLYWQKKEFGSVLDESYGKVVLRYVQRIFACEEFRELRFKEASLSNEEGDDSEKDIEEEEARDEKLRRSLILTGKRKGCKDLIIELGSTEMRNELLTGLRNMRCDASMLFQQNLDKMKEKGFF